MAVATALYVTELCPRTLRTPVTVLVELLAAVPSVVYGLWGIFVLIPKLLPAEKWFASTFSFIPFIGGGTVDGPNYFIAGLILAIMIVPIVSAITREVMSTVPADHKEAALALGATRWEMIRTAVLPYSRAGITGAAMLGLGRAIGETIAVTLVIGNAPTIGHHLFNQGYTLSAVIANEFGEAGPGSLHDSALIAAGLLLFVLTLIVNAVARIVVRRAAARRPATAPASHRVWNARMSAVALVPISRARRRRNRLAQALVAAGTVVALIPLVLIVYYLIEKGAPAWNADFFTTDPTGAFLGSPGGIKSAILGTVEIVVVASAIAIPAGVAVALYLTEYGRASRFAAVVRYFLDVLTGVPSIVFGLFIYTALVVTGFGGGSFAGWKGAVALALLMLPVVARSAEVVLLLVPDGLREAALALGRAALARRGPCGAADGLRRADDRCAARGGSRRRRDRAADLHLEPRQRHELQPQQGDDSSLPLVIYNDVGQAQSRLVTVAWGAALTLVAMILLLTMVARLVRESEQADMSTEPTQKEDAVSEIAHAREENRVTVEPAGAPDRAQAGRAAGSGRRPPRQRRAAERVLRRQAQHQGHEHRVRAERGDGTDRAVRLGQVDGHTLHQPDARGDPGRPRDRLDPSRRHRRLRPRGRRRLGSQDDRDGLPEAQPVPDDVDLRQRRGGSAS